MNKLKESTIMKSSERESELIASQQVKLSETSRPSVEREKRINEYVKKINEIIGKNQDDPIDIYYIRVEIDAYMKHHNDEISMDEIVNNLLEKQAEKYQRDLAVKKGNENYLKKVENMKIQSEFIRKQQQQQQN